MYNIDLKNIRKDYLFGFIFFLTGLIVFTVFLTVSLSALNNKNKYDSQTTATELNYKSYKNNEGTTMYTPIYYFEVDGIEYSCKSSASSSSKSANKNEIIYYDKNDPSDCMPEHEENSATIFIFFSAIPLVFVIVGLVLILNVRKKVKRAKYLAEYGTLIKNLPYTMVNSNITVNGVRIQSIAVEYTLPDGTIEKLIGNPRYDHKMGDEDQLVDLLIDPTDPSNYFIDFNIEPKY